MKKVEYGSKKLIDSVYNMSVGFSFALCRLYRNKVYRLSINRTCREQLIQILRNALFYRRNRMGEDLITEVLDDKLFINHKFNVTEIMVTSYDKYTKRELYNILQNSIKILNIIEDKFGFSKTKILEITGINKLYESYYIRGDKKWCYSPQMLSLYLLLIRLSVIKIKKEINSFEKLIEYLLSKKYDTHKLVSKAFCDDLENDLEFIKIVKERRLALFLNNIDKIFQCMYSNYTHNIKKEDEPDLFDLEEEGILMFMFENCDSVQQKLWTSIRIEAGLTKTL